MGILNRCEIYHRKYRNLVLKTVTLQSLKRNINTWMTFKIITSEYLSEFENRVKPQIAELTDHLEDERLEVDYFQFYNSVSSVYSSKIEGENIDFDSFYKHKFLKVPYKPDYTQRADDLFSAYEFIQSERLSLNNLKIAHKILSAHLLPQNQQGIIRNNPMFVINSDDRIEYVATDPDKVLTELENLFDDINVLLQSDLKTVEVFYYASFIHLVFVKIHPFQDGNGRTARLLEKWFLIEKLGRKAFAIKLEKNYYINLELYYRNIRNLGIEYDHLDYSKSLDFLLMTIKSL